MITGWDGLAARADLTEGATTQVLIRLSVSAEDEGVPLRLIGDDPLHGLELRPLTDNPSILQARVEVPIGEWSVTVDGCPNIDGADATGALVLAVTSEQPTLDLWSASCHGAPALVARELDYIAGIYTPDLFSPDMPRLTETTYQSIEDAGGASVALSSVLAYGRTLPTPTLERRQGFASSVMTPTWALRYQARSASNHDLTTFMAPSSTSNSRPAAPRGSAAFATKSGGMPGSESLAASGSSTPHSPTNSTRTSCCCQAPSSTPSGRPTSWATRRPSTRSTPNSPP